MRVIDQIKNSLTCIEYMQRVHNSKIVNNRCKSFRPDAKNNTSLMVNEQDWCDFGTNYGGDVIDLCALDKFDGNKGKAIKHLCEMLNIENEYVKTEDIEIVLNTYLGILDDASKIFNSFLNETHRTYFHKRGITDQTINDLRLGWSDNPVTKLEEIGYSTEDIIHTGILTWINRFVFPYMRNGKCKYMISRTSNDENYPSNFPDCKYMKLKRTEESENPIWGIDTLTRKGHVIIAEGIMDAISCYQEGYAVLTAVTGAFSANQKKELYSLLKNRDVIICMDYDPITKAGQAFTEKLAEELWDNGINCKVVNLNNGKLKLDINELYADNPCKETLDNVFSKAEKWIDIKLDKIYSIINEDERKKAYKIFMKSLTFRLDFADIAQYLAFAKEEEFFPKEWLSELKKELKSPPSELEIIKLFKDKYEVLYHPQLGWHIYNENVWERAFEEEIGKLVIETWGKYATSARVSAIKKMLKDELKFKGEFNTDEDLINFPNGMFSLSQGKLIEHDKKYLSSIQMTYNYKEDADCPRWKKFIEEITDNSEERINLIQEMFGYVLDRSLQLQKCFYLNGAGANGKSVLLKTLEALVGYKNATHIELAYMDSPFNRIQLMNSMVNVCMDMKTDVKGVESYFKAIVSGDPIDGCYKGKDIINFIPKSKMFFAANEMLSMRTVDFSILRRIVFLNFPMTFCNDPKKENERLIDYQLQSKLETELAGIFNWALEGYKKIKNSRQFTETIDQTTMSYETKSLNNPLISFVEDWASRDNVILTEKKDKKQVFAEYLKWCEENFFRPISSNLFWRRMREVFPYTTSKTSGNCKVLFNEPMKYKQ